MSQRITRFKRRSRSQLQEEMGNQVMSPVITPKKRSKKPTSTSVRKLRQTRLNNLKARKNSHSAEPTLIIHSDEEEIGTDLKQLCDKKVESVAKRFCTFKDLLSDNEEEEEEPVKTETVSKPKRYNENIYTISDSESEEADLPVAVTFVKPCASGSANDLSASCSGSTMNCSDAMKVVDEILNITDSTFEEQSIVVQDADFVDNLNELKVKTKSMLSSISECLNDIKEDLKDVEVKPSAPSVTPEKSKLTCPICLETLSSEVGIMTTACGHIFCKGCITQVAKTLKKCPTCRKGVNLKKIHPLYLNM